MGQKAKAVTDIKDFLPPEGKNELESIATVCDLILGCKT